MLIITKFDIPSNNKKIINDKRKVIAKELGINVWIEWKSFLSKEDENGELKNIPIGDELYQK